MRVTPEEFARIDLRAHSLLADVPLHDAWATDLPGGGPGRSMLDLRRIASLEALASANAAVRSLFRLRRGLGRILGFDRAPPRTCSASYLDRLSAADRAASRVPPGSREGPFQVLYVSPREAISEIRNATVHAFSVLALLEVPGGYRLYWAIYVRPVGRITAWYMALIDPFRRFVVYPATLRYIRSAWADSVGSDSPRTNMAD